SFFFILPTPPCSTLFPYTTLFRSRRGVAVLEFLGELDRPRVEERRANQQRILQRNGDEVEPPNFAAVAAAEHVDTVEVVVVGMTDRKSTRLNSSHVKISYAVFCLK